MTENFQNLIKKVRSGKEISPEKVKSLNDDEFDIFIKELARPPFIPYVDAITEKEQELADKELDEINKENGYTKYGDIIDDVLKK
jgi:hypothetical protein